MIEPLSPRLESAIADIVGPTDEVMVKIKGAFQEALVCTRSTVTILKTGFMTGNMFGVTTFQLPYRNITGVEVNFNLISGYFELSSGGVQNVERSFWSSLPATDAKRAANCIGLLTSEQADKFRDACRIILRLQSENIHPPVPSSDRPLSVADEIAKLAALRKDGALTEAEFDSEKARLLSDPTDGRSAVPTPASTPIWRDEEDDEALEASPLELAMDEAIRARQAAEADGPSDTTVFGRRVKRPA